MDYPVRCQIVDVAGQEVFPGIVGKTPDISKPHVGEYGLAEKLPDGNVKITLDNGDVLMGYECWWQPVAHEQSNEAEKRIQDGEGICPVCHKLFPLFVME